MPIFILTVTKLEQTNTQTHTMLCGFHPQTIYNICERVEIYIERVHPSSPLLSRSKSDYDCMSENWQKGTVTGEVGSEPGSLRYTMKLESAPGFLAIVDIEHIRKIPAT